MKMLTASLLVLLVVGCASAESAPHTQPAATTRPAGGAVTFYGVEDRAQRVAYLLDKTDLLRMDYIKREITRSIIRLAADQRFFIATYCEFTQFAPGEKASYIAATAENKAKVADWVKKVFANSWNGSIRPDKALEAAFKAEGGPPDVIFLVMDSLFPPETPDLIAKLNAGGRTRIHTILVEDWVADTSARKIAEQTGGKCRVLSKEELERFAGEDPKPTTQPAAEAFRITGRKAEDRVVVTAEGDRTVFTVICPSGIGSATVERTGDAWPKVVVLRLNLNGLESLGVSVGGTAISGSVGSGGVRLHAGAKDLAKGDDLWMEIQRGDGVFKMVLPNALLDEKAKTLKIDWIDFFRG